MLELLYLLVFLIGMAEIAAFLYLVRGLVSLANRTRQVIIFVREFGRLMREQADAEDELDAQLQGRLESLCRRMES